MRFDVKEMFWINQPSKSRVQKDKVLIYTEPKTDFWQKTYYGFCNDNAHALLMKTDEEYFSFTIKTEFDSKRRFDQCGVIVYQNSDNLYSLKCK